MAIPTVSGLRQQYFFGLPSQGAQDLSALFANSFQSLMNRSGFDDDEGGMSSLSSGVGNDGLDLRQSLDSDDDSQASFLGGQDTISAAGDGTNGSSSQLSLGGTLSFLGGVGSGTRSVGDNATIFGTANSVYHYAQQATDGSSVFRPEFYGAAPGADNILFDASNSHQSLDALAGLGDTIKGGDASDTISVQNTVDGTNAGATLSGGSGSANLFQFLNNKGGHYTIADFGKAAGNQVGLKATQQEIGQMLEHQSITGGNVTVDLPNDQGQITFLDQQQLHPKDFHSF
ncbi:MULTISPECIES: hypothetical protein [Bombella]|uniref:Calcium-binding protein n=1 Tax=Bombella pollinis TaxID=2967337 RepID=A0ABT3WQS2_9PROT|nr:MULTISPECIES: hypothetical protein [Bombella]MCX5619181.1 hypothetical protein [Bombella pollinis]MUG05541.1 hypothetical protein [Bombella sp. ESL0378]